MLSKLQTVGVIIIIFLVALGSTVLILKYKTYPGESWKNIFQYRLLGRTPPASNGQPGQGVGGNPNTGLGRGGRGGRRPSTGYPIVPDDQNDHVGTPALGGPANDYYGGMPVEDAYEVGPMN